MILFNLICAAGHEFEGWFRDGATYDLQAAAGEIACPICGDHHVRKAPMAPRVLKGRGAACKEGDAAKTEDTGDELREALVTLRNVIEKNWDDVGNRFAEEARRMHYGEAKKRPVFGEATLNEARELVEEGIEVMPMPWKPRHDA